MELEKLSAARPIKANNWQAIDLSAARVQELGLDLGNQKAIESWFQDQRPAGTVLHGGYMEKRSWYGRNPGFKSEQETRNIHIGLDIWADAGEPVFACLDGMIYGMGILPQAGDYGHVIIIKHEVKGEWLFSLYGHLAPFNSELKLGMEISKGAQIATLGSWSENGAWPAHLHFQLIRDMGHYRADYPGVCFEKEQDFYQQNCPDPRLLLDLI